MGWVPMETNTFIFSVATSSRQSRITFCSACLKEHPCHLHIMPHFSRQTGMETARSSFRSEISRSPRIFSCWHESDQVCDTGDRAAKRRRSDIYPYDFYLISFSVSISFHLCVSSPTDLGLGRHLDTGQSNCNPYLAVEAIFKIFHFGSC